MSGPVDVLAVIRPRPFWANPNVTLLIACATDKWQRMTERAKESDAEFTTTLAKVGQSNPDRDAGLCAMQRQQARDGYMLVQLSWSIYGFCVRDTLNDGMGVLWSGRSDDGTAEGALQFAAEWQSRDPGRREVVLSGYFPEDIKMANGIARNLRSEIDTAIARVGGAA
ncbi:MAG: hypothetical protein V4641_05780 [Pseudomonadota bacterium]